MYVMVCGIKVTFVIGKEKASTDTHLNSTLRLHLHTKNSLLKCI